MIEPKRHGVGLKQFFRPAALYYTLGAFEGKKYCRYEKKLLCTAYKT